MSRVLTRIPSLVGFGTGVLVVLLVGGGVPTAIGQKKQAKQLEVPPAPQAPTLTAAAAPSPKKKAGKGGKGAAGPDAAPFYSAKPGAVTELVLHGTNLTDPTAVLLSCPGKATPAEEKGGDGTQLKVKVELPADAPVGMHTIRVATKDGVSNFRPLAVDDLSAVNETGNNRTKETAQELPVPCVVTGRVAVEQSGFFRMKVAAGQRLTFEVLARRLGSPLDPVIRLHDAKTMRELVALYADDTPGLQGDCRLTHTFPEAGELIVEVHETTYRGGPDFYYRLRVGEFPGATTAFPLAAQRGKNAKVGFAGPGAEGVPAVEVKAPADPAIAAIDVAPKWAAGVSGWPVPVLLSDDPQTVEQEPNDTPAKANKLPVPGGVSARFAGKDDHDHFAVSGKKGQKLVAEALTYELNAPTEVLIRVLDAKGAEKGRSSPTQTPARVEFTPAEDGEYVIACEHLNYLHGPNEVYHLSVRPAGPDFTVTLALDRYEAPAGGGTAVAATEVTRLNGYAGPVELSIAGGPELSGSVTVPAGQTVGFVPLMVKAGAKPGAYPFRVRAKATVDGKDVVRFATTTELVRANLGGLPNPPPDLLGGCAVAVTDEPAFALTLKAEPGAVEKGKSAKLVVEATREKAADADIALAQLYAAPNVTATAKPVPKGQTKGEATVAVAAGATAGPNVVVLRATTKVGGKDYVVTPPPVVLEVIDAKKGDAKKEEPKKEEPKKKDKK